MKKVVIIEKDKTFVEKIEKTFTSQDVRIVQVTDFDDGLKISKADNTELIIIGITPSTLETACKMALQLKAYSQKNVPVVIASSLENYSGYKFDPTDRSQYMPVDDLIDKNANNEDLKHKLISLLYC